MLLLDVPVCLDIPSCNLSSPCFDCYCLQECCVAISKRHDEHTQSASNTQPGCIDAGGLKEHHIQQAARNGPIAALDSAAARIQLVNRLQRFAAECAVMETAMMRTLMLSLTQRYCAMTAPILSASSMVHISNSRRSKQCLQYVGGQSDLQTMRFSWLCTSI